MRVVLIGVSHWHTPFFLDPCLEMADVAIVGVSDPDLSRAEPMAAKAGCKAFPDYRDMCASVKPDFAFALAPHNQMAALARFLIDARIPFAMEKPCAIDAAEAAEVASRAAAAGVFAAVPYVIRYSPMVETILSLNEPVHYAMFKFIGGMVDRYRQQRVEWVIDRATSGGGPLLNLGVHFMDMCRVLLKGRRSVGDGIDDLQPPGGAVDRGPCRGADAGRRCELHGGDGVSVSGAELGLRPALQYPDRGSLLCRAG